MRLIGETRYQAKTEALKMPKPPGLDVVEASAHGSIQCWIDRSIDRGQLQLHRPLSRSIVQESPSILAIVFEPSGRSIVVVQVAAKDVPAATVSTRASTQAVTFILCLLAQYRRVEFSSPRSRSSWSGSA